MDFSDGEDFPDKWHLVRAGSGWECSSHGSEFRGPLKDDSGQESGVFTLEPRAQMTGALRAEYTRIRYEFIKEVPASLR